MYQKCKSKFEISDSKTLASYLVGFSVMLIFCPHERQSPYCCIVESELKLNYKPDRIIFTLWFFFVSLRNIIRVSGPPPPLPVWMDVQEHFDRWRKVFEKFWSALEILKGLNNFLQTIKSLQDSVHSDQYRTILNKFVRAIWTWKCGIAQIV